MQELEQLRAAAAALKQDIEHMRASQENQRKQEESLVLGQLKKTVQALQAETAAISDQQHAVGLCPVHLDCSLRWYGPSQSTECASVLAGHEVMHWQKEIMQALQAEARAIADREHAVILHFPISTSCISIFSTSNAPCIW